MIAISLPPSTRVAPEFEPRRLQGGVPGLGEEPEAAHAVQLHHEQLAGRVVGVRDIGRDLHRGSPARGTSTAADASATTAPSNRSRRTVACPLQASAVSLPMTAARPASRGWTVTMRGANAVRRAWNSGFGRSSPSIAAHDVTGQQSLSCHTIAPIVCGAHERKCSSAVRTATAWLSCIAQCHVSMSSGTRKWDTSPFASLTLPSIAFWCTIMPGDSGVSG